MSMSRERRFLVEAWDGDHARLEGNETHHLTHVLRLGVGDEIVVFDGRGKAARARVHRMGSETVELRIVAPLPARESFLRLTMAVAPPKGDKMSLVVRALTELGVQRIRPLLTARGELGGDEIGRRLPRWRRIAVEACKQSGRARLPEITPASSLREVLNDSGGASILMASPHSPPLGHEPSPERAPLTALVGPEGGWSEEEILAAVAHGNVRPFGLGPRTLRTETAAAAAASLLQWLRGDWGPDSNE